MEPQATDETSVFLGKAGMGVGKEALDVTPSNPVVPSFVYKDGRERRISYEQVSWKITDLEHPPLTKLTLCVE